MTNTAAGHKTKSAHDIHLGAAPLHFKRILFATDFSPQASAAFKTAVRLSQNYGSMLYLAHVVSPMLYAPNGGVVAPALQQAEIESAHERLGHHITRMPEPGAIKYQQIVTCGMAKELIPAIVKENHIDLLAMGSHGRDGVSKLAWIGRRSGSAPRALSGARLRTALQAYLPSVQIHPAGNRSLA